jgi:hypothetical protein
VGFEVQPVTDNRFKRDLPAPPRRGQDNYTSALVQVEAALDTAWHVAPTEEDREQVDEWRDEVRDELRDLIQHLGDD